MTTKPNQSTSKASLRPVRKSLKGATETMRLFIDVNDVNDTIRRTQAMPLTRYVE